MQPTLNGIRVNFTDDGAGTPLLFVHGFPLDRNSWEPQILAFAADHRCIAPDLRGFGDTEATVGVATMEQFADDLAALLQHLRLESAVIIGHSMGGYIALAFARKYAKMLRGLVLVATRSTADSPDAAAGRRATAEKVRTEGTAPLIANMAPKMIAAGNAHSGLPDFVQMMMGRASQDGVVATLRGLADRPDSTPLLPTITVPTLVITGTDDDLIPASESEKMAAVIPRARLEKIAGAGHLVAYEKPAEFNAALRRWLADSRL